MSRESDIFAHGGRKGYSASRLSGGKYAERNATKNTALGYEASGGRAMQGLVTPLELVVVPYFRSVWAYCREARRRLVTP